MSLDLSIQIAGATLASVLSDLGSVEGLIFGQRVTKSVTTLQDSDSSHSHSSTTLVVQSFVSTGTSLSFYSATGVVDTNMVASLLKSRGNQVLLGWFRCRPGTPVRVSLRESAVNESLNNLFKSQGMGGSGASSSSGSGGSGSSGSATSIPPIFGLFSSCETSGGFLSREHVFLNTRGAGGFVESIPVRVVNVMHSSEAEYTSFSAISSFTTDKLPVLMKSDARERFVANVKDLESVCESLLMNTKELTTLVCESEAELRNLKEAVTVARSKAGGTASGTGAASSSSAFGPASSSSSSSSSSTTPLVSSSTSGVSGDRFDLLAFPHVPPGTRASSTYLPAPPPLAELVDDAWMASHGLGPR